jgi:PAS domain S-box-containing protein
MNATPAPSGSNQADSGGGGLLYSRETPPARKLTLLSVVVGIAVGFLVPFGLLALAQQHAFIALLDFASALFLSGALLYARKTGRIRGLVYAGIGLAVAHLSYLFLSGGVARTGFLWYYTFPLTACYLLGSRRGTAVSLAALAFILLNPLLAPLSGRFAAYPPDFLARYAASYLVVILFSASFEKSRASAHRRISRQNAALQATLAQLEQSRSELQRASDELERRVEERTAELTSANARLQETDEALRLTQFAVDRGRDAAFWITPDGRFFYVNQAACQALGYTREELLGMTVHDIGPQFLPETWHAHWEEVRRQGALTFESPHRRKDGSLFPTEIVANWVRFGGREFLCAFARDISERKQAEERLRQGQKMDAIGQLAGGVAHDFNNMLGGISGAAELLLLQLPVDAPQRKYARTILEAAGHAADLTGKLLAFSRKGRVVSSTLDLHAPIRAAIALLERSIDRRIRIETDFASAALRVVGDAALLQSMFLNLALNARDAMPEGGTLRFASGTMVLDAAACGRLAPAVAPGDYHFVEVSDTGHGMTSEVQRQIFEPFFTTKGVGKGTGLGLAAVYGTVREHQGVITVESRPGAGTRFRIHLPAAAEGQADAAVAGERVVRGGGRILVVDDEALIRELARESLELLGYEVLTAANGSQAIETFRRAPEAVALVILDMVMPELNGRDTFLRLREIDPAVRVLFSSGYAREEKMSDLLALGAMGFVQKPYRIADLSVAVARALGSEGGAEPGGGGPQCAT